eukprot:6997793-Pyramimonas_sp.AAC.1
MEIERSCPTPQLVTIHIALQAMASRKFEATVGDVTTAFMQGDPSKRTKPLYAEPPAGGYLESLGVPAGCLIRLDREVYGLVSGMAAWRSTMVDRLSKLNYRMSIYDPCLFCLFSNDPHDESKDPIVQGIVVLEVDDALSGGTDLHNNKMKQLRTVIKFGHWHSLYQDGPHYFAGRRFTQEKDF